MLNYYNIIKENRKVYINLFGFEKSLKLWYNYNIKKLKGGFHMEAKFALQTVFEVFLVVLVIVALCNNKKLIAFEDKIFAKLKKRFAKK